MKTFLRLFCSCLILALVGFVGRSQGPAPAQIENWIEDLGSGEFVKREQAQKNLWKAGTQAEEFLKKAVKRDDPEIRKRCQELLEKFKWGIYVDTPVAIVDLIQAYQSSPADKKEEHLNKLLEAGLPGIRSAIKVLQAEEQAEIRLPLVTHVSKRFPQAVPSLVEANEMALLQQFLFFLLECRAEGAHSHLAAFAVLDGRVKEQLEKSRDPKFGRMEKDTRDVLGAYLHRALGDTGQAAAIAKKAGHEILACNLFLENGDWSAVLKGNVYPDDLMPGKLGYRLAMARLAGDEKEFQAIFKDFEVPDEKQENESQLGKIALINGRKKEGLDWLIRSGNKQMVLELLIAGFQHPEAEKLVAEARELADRSLPLMELTLAKAHYSVGKREAALAVFSKYSKQLKEKAEGDWPIHLIQSLTQLKLKTEARDAATLYLSQPDQRESAARILKALYGDGEEYLDPVLRYLFKKDSSVSAKEIMPVIQKLVDRKCSKEELQALVGEMLEYSKRVISSEGVNLLRACARHLKTHGAVEELEKLCQEASDEKCWMELADLQAGTKKWSLAREVYLKAWKMNKGNPLPVFLAGRMARAEGLKSEEEKWTRLARWIPLGNDQVRTDFAFALARRGFPDEAQKEFTLVKQTGEPGSFHVGTATRALTGSLVAKKKFLDGANAYELALLRCMTPYVTFLQSPAYLGVPAITYRLRARDFAEKGEFLQCEKYLSKAQELFPADVDLPILVYEVLAGKGKKEMADRVFQTPKTRLDEICAMYPGCAWAHNSAAWMSACCKRDLDWGLSHSQKAVQIDPESPAYHDTLAEVLFQLGRQKEALEEQQKAVALDPVKVYYRKQLQRIGKGNPRADKPDENEDEE
ncbi:MAG: hypothetical protein EXR99_04475 [Gemmataceae bacterium]|nr:hypothetical protein [Gemmataceae bacterium]